MHSTLSFPQLSQVCPLTSTCGLTLTHTLRLDCCLPEKYWSISGPSFLMFLESVSLFSLLVFSWGILGSELGWQTIPVCTGLKSFPNVRLDSHVDSLVWSYLCAQQASLRWISICWAPTTCQKLWSIFTHYISLNSHDSSVCLPLTPDNCI